MTSSKLDQLGFAIGVLVMALPCCAQMSSGYQVSVYTSSSLSSDFSTFYGLTNSVDSSSGCANHYNYQTSTSVTNPDGTSASARLAGMSASVGLPTNGEPGTFSIGGQLTANCGCSYGLGFGGGSGTNVTVDYAKELGIFEDTDGRVLLSQDEFNQLVSQGDVAAGAGVIVLVPGAGEIVIAAAGVTIIAVGALYLTLVAATYIKDHLHPLATGPCTLSQQNNGVSGSGIGSGTVQCIYSCLGYGALVTMYCPTGTNCATYVPDGWLRPARDCH